MIDPTGQRARRANERVAAISDWVDNSPANANRDREALMWHRVAKPAEEAGEVIDEMIKFVGGNPRKRASETDEAVVEELLDTALAALGGVEHLRGNLGVALSMLFDKIDRVYERAMQT